MSIVRLWVTDYLETSTENDLIVLFSQYGPISIDKYIFKNIKALIAQHKRCRHL